MSTSMRDNNLTLADPAVGVAITPEQFAEAYRNGHGKTVGALVRKYGLGRSDAERFAADAWCVAWEKRHQLRDVKCLIAFVITIAFHLAATEFRKNKSLDQLAPVHDAVSTSDISLERIILVHTNLDQLLELCTARQRKALELRYFYEMTTEEIATKMSTTADGVSSLLARTRRMLREIAGGLKSAA